MQIRPEALATALERRPESIVWIHGDEPLLSIEAGDLVRAHWRRAGAAERQVFHVERSFRLEQLREEAGALSLFATQRILELRMTAKPGKELGSGLAELAPLFSAETRLLVSSPRLDKAVTESAWFRPLEAHALIVPIFPVDRGALPQWIAQRLGAQRQRADAATLALIAERVEGNLLAAQQEIRKLGLLFPEGALPADEVAQAVLQVSRQDAFGLVDAMLAGDLARVFRSLEGLRAEGEPEPLVLWSLADCVRSLLRLSQIRDAGQNPSARMREFRIWPPRDQLYGRALQRLRTPQLEEALQAAAGVDRIIKGLAPGNPWSAMRALATTIAGARLPAPAAT